MGLIKNEAFVDRVYITVTATGAAAIGLVPTCFEVDESDNRAAKIVAEIGNGWYKCTNLTPDNDGTWCTEWAVAGAHTIHYPFKEFKVGGGQEATIITDIAALNDVSTAQVNTEVDTGLSDQDLDHLIQVTAGAEEPTDGSYLDQIMHKDAGQTFDSTTDSLEILGEVAAAIKAKTDNLPVDPADDSDLDTQLAAINAQNVIIDAFHDVPAKDAVANAQMRDVVGNKTDDPDWFVTNDQSLMGYVKAAAASGSGVSYGGLCDVGMAPSTVTVVCDDLKGFGDDFFNTDWVMEIALNDNSHGNAPEGNAPRDVQDYVSATGTFTVAAFSANVEASDRIIVSKRHLQVIDKTALAAIPATDSLSYKISKFLADGDGDFAAGTPLPANTSLYDTITVIDEFHDVPAIDGALNLQVNEVVGNKSDTVGGDSLVALVKQVNAQNVVIDEFHDVPAQDAAANAQINEVIGNKTDTVGGTSLVSLVKVVDVNVDDIETDTSDIQPRVPRITCHMDFWSNLQEEAQFGAADEANVIALPDVVVADLPAGVTITRAIAMFLCRAIENTNAVANAVDVATGHIEVRDDSPSAWVTAIDIPDNSFGIAATTREMGTVIMGDNDISGTVDGNDTYNFEFDDIGADQDHLNFNDLQTGLRIYFTV